MKTGDLVKMKYESWWKLRSQKKGPINECGIVYSTHAKGVKILLPDGNIKVGLIDHWEVINESG